MEVGEVREGARQEQLDLVGAKTFHFFYSYSSDLPFALLLQHSRSTIRAQLGSLGWTFNKDNEVA